MSDLEKLVSEALRAAPVRRAPRSLEQRIWREIARRAALPWWRHSFPRWPRLAQAGLALTCGTIIWAVSWAAASPLSGAWLRPALTLLDAARDLDASLMGAVPLDWLYGATAAAALLYVALFGLGAAAYRTLYLQPTVTLDHE
ncbi:MAG TPA: hypothetical protein VHY75_05625 [Steroidobacteraceae bacterium]|jgi:hypothetical protein|nr:hypothetical protein [Steroidobacteraceae bacterium]